MIYINVIFKCHVTYGKGVIFSQRKFYQPEYRLIQFIFLLLIFLGICTVCLLLIADFRFLYWIQILSCLLLCEIDIFPDMLSANWQIKVKKNVSNMLFIYFVYINLISTYCKYVYIHLPIFKVIYYVIFGFIMHHHGIRYCILF